MLTPCPLPSPSIQVASRLDADGLLACVAEAVGDVSVEQSDLTRSVFKTLYRRTLDGIVGSGKIPAGPAKLFLLKLMARKPCVEVGHRQLSQHHHVPAAT